MNPDSERRPNWIAAIATVIWAIAVGLIARIVLVITVQQWGGPRAVRWFESTPAGLAVGALVIQLALFGLVLVRGSHLPELRQGIISSTRTRKSHWALALLFILGIGPLANEVGLVVAKVTGSGIDSMEFISGLIRKATVPELILLGVVLTVFPAVVEESLFRGLLMRSLSGLRVPVMISIQALAFGLFHLDVAQGTATFVLGLGFGFIAYSTGSLMGSMVAHGGYNLMVLLSQRMLAGGAEPQVKVQVLELTIGAVFAAVAGKQLYYHSQNRPGVSS